MSEGTPLAKNITNAYIQEDVPDMIQRGIATEDMDEGTFYEKDPFPIGEVETRKVLADRQMSESECKSECKGKCAVVRFCQMKTLQDSTRNIEIELTEKEDEAIIPETETYEVGVENIVRSIVDQLSHMESYSEITKIEAKSLPNDDKVEIKMFSNDGYIETTIVSKEGDVELIWLQQVSSGKLNDGDKHVSDVSIQTGTMAAEEIIKDLLSLMYDQDSFPEIAQIEVYIDSDENEINIKLVSIDGLTETTLIPNEEDIQVFVKQIPNSIKCPVEQICKKRNMRVPTEVQEMDTSKSVGITESNEGFKENINMDEIDVEDIIRDVLKQIYGSESFNDIAKIEATLLPNEDKVEIKTVSKSGQIESTLVTKDGDIERTSDRMENSDISIQTGAVIADEIVRDLLKLIYRNSYNNIGKVEIDIEDQGLINVTLISKDGMTETTLTPNVAEIQELNALKVNKGKCPTEELCKKKNLQSKLTEGVKEEAKSKSDDVIEKVSELSKTVDDGNVEEIVRDMLKQVYDKESLDDIKQIVAELLPKEDNVEITIVSKDGDVETTFISKELDTDELAEQGSEGKSEGSIENFVRDMLKQICATKSFDDLAKISVNLLSEDKIEINLVSQDGHIETKVMPQDGCTNETCTKRIRTKPIDKREVKPPCKCPPKSDRVSKQPREHSYDVSHLDGPDKENKHQIYADDKPSERTRSAGIEDSRKPKRRPEEDLQAQPRKEKDSPEQVVKVSDFDRYSSDDKQMPDMVSTKDQSKSTPNYRSSHLKDLQLSEDKELPTIQKQHLKRTGNETDESADEWTDALDDISKGHQKPANYYARPNYQDQREMKDIDLEHHPECECIDCLTAPGSKAITVRRAPQQANLECPMCNRLECIGNCTTAYEYSNQYSHPEDVEQSLRDSNRTPVYSQRNVSSDIVISRPRLDTDDRARHNKTEEIGQIVDRDLTKPTKFRAEIEPRIDLKGEVPLIKVDPHAGAYKETEQVDSTLHGAKIETDIIPSAHQSLYGEVKQERYPQTVDESSDHHDTQRRQITSPKEPSQGRVKQDVHSPVDSKSKSQDHDLSYESSHVQSIPERKHHVDSKSKPLHHEEVDSGRLSSNEEPLYKQEKHESNYKRESKSKPSQHYGEVETRRLSSSTEPSYTQANIAKEPQIDNISKPSHHDGEVESSRLSASTEPIDAKRIQEKDHIVDSKSQPLQRDSEGEARKLSVSKEPLYAQAKQERESSVDSSSKPSKHESEVETKRLSYDTKPSYEHAKQVDSESKPSQHVSEVGKRRLSSSEEPLYAQDKVVADPQEPLCKGVCAQQLQDKDPQVASKSKPSHLDSKVDTSRSSSKEPTYKEMNVQLDSKPTLPIKEPSHSQGSSSYQNTDAEAKKISSTKKPSIATENNEDNKPTTEEAPRDVKPSTEDIENKPIKNETDRRLDSEPRSVSTKEMIMPDTYEHTKKRDAVPAKEEMAELQNLMEQISCACSEAESRAQSVTSSPVYKQDPLYETTMSGLQMALKNLQQKCHNKDAMIEAMTQELKLRASSNMFEELLNTISKETRVRSVPDFDRQEICDRLPRPIHSSKYGRPSATDNMSRPSDDDCIHCPRKSSVKLKKPKSSRSNRSSRNSTPSETDSCLCPPGESVNVTPLKMKEVKRIGFDSLLVKWVAPTAECVLGYELCANNVIKTRVFNRNRTTAVMSSIPFNSSTAVNISVYACTEKGRCLPPATAMFQV